MYKYVRFGCQIAISGCRSLSQLFVSTFFELAVVENTRVQLETNTFVVLVLKLLWAFLPPSATRARKNRSAIRGLMFVCCLLSETDCCRSLQRGRRGRCECLLSLTLVWFDASTRVARADALGVNGALESSVQTWYILEMTWFGGFRVTGRVRIKHQFRGLWSPSPRPYTGPIIIVN